MSLGPSVKGQVGGQRSFEFLHLPNSAQVSGLGGVNVSLRSDDVNAFFANPALSKDSLAGQAAVNFMAYFAGINYTNLAYVTDVPHVGYLSIGLQHLSLGEIEGLDPAGQAIADVRSGETALTLGHAHQWGPFSIGANLKWVGSNIAGFRASALMLDLGGAFVHPEKDWVIGLAFKNLGFLFSDYSATADSKVPWDIQLGSSFKPKHMPFRFSITAHQLYRGDIVYNDPNDPAANGQEPEEAGLGEMIFRHFVFGTELLVSKNLVLRLGYNALVRKELRLEETAGGAGFSYGLGFRVKRFSFAYSRGGYHAAGGAHHFSISTDLKSLVKKKKK